MVSIIVPKSPNAINRPFADLVQTPMEMNRVANTMARILAQSFKSDEELHGVDFRKRIQTQNEINRRTNILGRWFRVLRGDVGLGIVRTLDELPKALKKELNGEEYSPPEKNRLWSPEGARQ